MLNGFVKLRGALEVWKQVVKIPVFSLNKSVFEQVICEKKTMQNSRSRVKTSLNNDSFLISEFLVEFERKKPD